MVKPHHICGCSVYYIYGQTLLHLWLVNLLQLWLKVITFMVSITFMVGITFIVFITLMGDTVALLISKPSKNSVSQTVLLPCNSKGLIFDFSLKPKAK